MKIIHCFIILCLLTTTLSSFCQNLRINQAYVVNLQGDTTRGRILNLQGIGTPRNLEFMNEQTKEVITLKPDEIRSFADNEGRLYLSAHVSVDYSPVETNSLLETPEPELKPETIFLEVLRVGKIDLYKTVLRSGRFLFYAQKEYDTIIPLVDYYYISRAKESDIAEFQRDNKIHAVKYLGQLSFMMADYPELQNEIHSVKYTQKDISSVIDSYNGHFESQESKQILRSDKTIQYFGVTLGAGAGKLSYLKFGSSQYDFTTDFPVRIGVDWHIIPATLKGRLQVRNQLSYEWYKTAASKSYTMSPVNYLDNLTFAPGSLILTNSARLYVSCQSLKFFVGAGITNSYFLHAKNELIRQSTIVSTTETETYAAVRDLVKYHLFYTVGVGIEYGRLGLELRFDPAKSLTKISSIDIFHQGFLFMLTYRFIDL